MQRGVRSNDQRAPQAGRCSTQLGRPTRRIQAASRRCEDEASSVLTIRSGVESDIPEVLALWAGVAAVTRVPSDATAVRRLIERDPDELVVAIVDGRVIGTVVSGWDGWRCHLYRIAVALAHQRSGTASELLDEVEARRAASGATRLDAMVHEGNGTGQAFWAGVGFHVDPDDRRWTRPIRTSQLDENG